MKKQLQLQSYLYFDWERGKQIHICFDTIKFLLTSILRVQKVHFSTQLHRKTEQWNPETILYKEFSLKKTKLVLNFLTAHYLRLDHNTTIV